MLRLANFSQEVERFLQGIFRHVGISRPCPRELLDLRIFPD